MGFLGFGKSADTIRGEIKDMEQACKVAEDLRTNQEIIADNLRKQLRAMPPHKSLQQEEQEKDLQNRIQECDVKIDDFDAQIRKFSKNIAIHQKRLDAMDAKRKKVNQTTH